MMALVVFVVVDAHTDAVIDVLIVNAVVDDAITWAVDFITHVGAVNAITYAAAG